MNEYMFLIRNARDAKSAMSPDDHLAFINKCEVYIELLKSQNKIIAAQPFIHEGVVLSNAAGQWQHRELSAAQEVQVGYYHIRAVDLQDAIETAKQNPEFEYVPSASIEIRPINTKETDTKFVYPTGSEES